MKNSVGLYFIMGTTCSGKSTFLNDAVKEYEDQVGIVQVGKLLRAKYPPEYFEGQAAPEKTKEEAWHICKEQVDLHMLQGKKIILVDGQPRDEEQANLCLDTWNKPNIHKHFILLDAPLEVRKSRAEKRFSKKHKDYKANLKLAYNRLEGDCNNYYYVLKTLINHNTSIRYIDTSIVKKQYNEVLFSEFDIFV
jgi:predicted kinase